MEGEWVNGLRAPCSPFSLTLRFCLHRFAISAIATPPSTNTILDIYGAWLFDAAIQKKEGYEAGRALALECLGLIFCTPSRR